MEKVIADIGIGENRRTNKQRHDGIVGLPIVERLWEIDKEYGKKVCLIELDIPSKSTYVNFTPSHDFCEEFLDKMLKCEWENDKFIFTHPKLKDSRPSQFRNKLKQLKKVINNWEQLSQNEAQLKLPMVLQRDEAKKETQPPATSGIPRE